MFYTRNGDDGNTSLWDRRVSKTSPVCQILGSLDELNTFLGLCAVKASVVNLNKLKSALETIQGFLFCIQSEIALSFSGRVCDKKLNNLDVLWLEKQIEIFSVSLDPIKDFCVSGGTELSALCDYARTIARRSECALVAYDLFLHKTKSVKDLSKMLSFINRLSSLLFIFARYVNKQPGVNSQR